MKTPKKTAKRAPSKKEQEEELKEILKNWKILTDDEKAQLYIDFEFFENLMLLKKHVDFLVS